MHNNIRGRLIRRATILLATYNKNEYLPNTLYSISRQEAEFPIDVYITDDHSITDPKPIVDKFLPNANYLRLENTKGFMFSHCYSMDRLSADTDIVIVISSDVILPTKTSVRDIAILVRPKIPIFSEVLNLGIPKDAYKNFDAEVSKVFSMWSKQSAVLGNVCTGVSKPKSWLFFFGAILRDDLEAIEFQYNCCDAVLPFKMIKLGFKPEIHPRIKAIHQSHGKQIIHPCIIENTCEYRCARNENRFGTSYPDKEKATIIDCLIDKIEYHNTVPELYKEIEIPKPKKPKSEFDGWTDKEIKNELRRRKQGRKRIRKKPKGS